MKTVRRRADKAKTLEQVLATVEASIGRIVEQIATDRAARRRARHRQGATGPHAS